MSIKQAAAALAELRRPVATRTRIAVALSAVGALASLVPFLALAELGETLLAGGPLDRGAVVTVTWLVVAGLGMRGLCTGLALAITHFADVDLQADLRRRIVRRLSGVPLGWFTDNSSGAVRKAAQNDIADLHHLVAHHSVEMTAAVVLPLGGLGYLFFLDWRLALLAVGTLPLYAVAYAWMMRGYQEKAARLNEAMGRISSAVVEFVTGISVVKAFGRARRAHETYHRAAREFGRFYAAWVRPMLRVEALSSMLISAPLVGLVSLLGVVWFTGAGWVTPVEAMTGVLVAMVIPTTVMALGFGGEERRTAASAALRLRELLATPTLPVPAEAQRPVDHRVEFDGVRFSYDGTTDVLRDVSLELRPGTVTALVGPVPWLVVDDEGVPVEPIRRYLIDFVHGIRSAAGAAADRVRFVSGLKAGGVLESVPPLKVGHRAQWVAGDCPRPALERVLQAPLGVRVLDLYASRNRPEDPLLAGVGAAGLGRQTALERVLQTLLGVRVLHLRRAEEVPYLAGVGAAGLGRHAALERVLHALLGVLVLEDEGSRCLCRCGGHRHTGDDDRRQRGGTSYGTSETNSGRFQCHDLSRHTSGIAG